MQGRIDLVTTDVLERVAGLVPRGGRPVLVAVDGGDGAGKTTFADRLATALVPPVVRATVDDFHLPRAVRYADGRTGASVWERSFDYPALRRELLDPWRRGAGSSYRRRWHDLEKDAYVDEPGAVVPERGVLVVDGVFAQRQELSGVWDLVVYLDCPDDERVARMAERDARSPDPSSDDQRRYLGAQRTYRRLCDPIGRADIVVDNTDPAHPQIVRPRPR